MKSVSGSFCLQSVFNLSSKNVSGAEMQWGTLPLCTRGKAEAAVRVSGVILPLKGEVG